MPKVKANGIEIFYEERGIGEPLLLIMGLGADGSMWEDHVKAYKKHFRCILMDNRGAGRSDKPEGPYTTAMMAKDTIGLMDALEISKAHISGISMGGAIAQELAINHPERVLSVTIISSWSKCDHYTTRIFDTLQSLVGVASYETFTRLLQLFIFSPGYHNDQLQDLLDREIKGSSNPYPMPVHAFQSQCQACVSHNTTDRLSGIKAPTLITVGDKDIFTPLDYSRILFESIEGSELVVIKEGAHTHHWEKLDEFNSRTLSFLMEHRQ